MLLLSGVASAQEENYSPRYQISNGTIAGIPGVEPKITLLLDTETGCAWMLLQPQDGGVSWGLIGQPPVVDPPRPAPCVAAKAD